MPGRRPSAAHHKNISPPMDCDPRGLSQAMTHPEGTPRAIASVPIPKADCRQARRPFGRARIRAHVFRHHGDARASTSMAPIASPVIEPQACEHIDECPAERALMPVNTARTEKHRTRSSFGCGHVRFRPKRAADSPPMPIPSSVTADGRFPPKFGAEFQLPPAGDSQARGERKKEGAPGRRNERVGL